MAHRRSAVLILVIFFLVPITSFAGTGVLEVLSQPSGARVTIDGADAGTTPYQNIEMPTGKHQVKAVLGPAYPPLVQEVVINELAPQVIRFKFVKQKKGTFVGEETVLTTEQYTGSAIFVSRPTGASVVIDGLPRKATPIGYADIEVGKYAVKFILGKRVLRSDFEVVRDETIKVIADFDKGKVFNTANEAKKRAAKKKIVKRDRAMPAEPEQMPPSPERAAMAPGTSETTEEELATETGTPEMAAPVVETAAGTGTIEKAAPAAKAAGTGTIEMAAPAAKAAGTGTIEKAAPVVKTAVTGTIEKAAPAVKTAATGTTEMAAPAMESAGTATTGGAVIALRTPGPGAILPASAKPEAAAEIPPQPEALPTPFGELAITVNVSREAGIKYSDYFIISFPKVPIKSLSGDLFPKASKFNDDSVSKDNFEYFNDADSNTRQFTATVHFGPTMTVLAYSGAHSDIITVAKGTYNLEITGRRILRHFVPDEKLMDETAREKIEIVPGNRLLVQIDGHIDADNKLRYEIKRTYENTEKKAAAEAAPAQNTLKASSSTGSPNNPSILNFTGGQD